MTRLARSLLPFILFAACGRGDDRGATCGEPSTNIPTRLVVRERGVARDTIALYYKCQQELDLRERLDRALDALTGVTHWDGPSPYFRREVADRASELERGDTAVFRGVYRFGFERSEFVECGASERWSVRTANRELARDLVFLLLRPFDDAPDSVGLGSGAAFVQLRGRPSARGEYGHLGSYQREFVLSEVVSLQDTIAGGCAVRD